MEYDPELAPVDTYLRGALRSTPLEPAQAQQWTQRAVARAEAPEFISAPEARGPLGRPHSSLAARVFSWAGAVAVACVIVAAGVRYTTPGFAPDHAASEAVATYQTLAGQQAIVTLPNGTHVTLGPVSTIKAWASAERTQVDLTGKALFVVHASVSNAFEVRTTTATARVLGTTFLVEEYPEDSGSTVAVVEGKVEVHAGEADARESSVILAGTQAASIGDSGSIQVLSDSDLTPYTGWAQGTLAFRKTPVRRIVAELTRVYGIDLRVEDSVLAQRTLTWQLETKMQSVTGVLRALTAVLDARIVQTDDGLVLVPGRIVAQPEKLPSMTERRYGR